MPSLRSLLEDPQESMRIKHVGNVKIIMDLGLPFPTAENINSEPNAETQKIKKIIVKMYHNVASSIG